jgi:hypothetical protein
MQARPGGARRWGRSLAVGFLLLGMGVGFPVRKAVGQSAPLYWPPPGAFARPKPPPEPSPSEVRTAEGVSEEHQPLIPAEPGPPPTDVEAPFTHADTGEIPGPPATYEEGPGDEVPPDLPPPTRLPQPGVGATPIPQPAPGGLMALPPSPLPDLPADPGWAAGGGGILGALFFPGEGCGCGGSACVPGREKTCYPCDGKTVVGRFVCGVYECICCPDPCYDPRWKPLADSAFFVEAARPVTQQRFRWDHGQNLIFPDRSEYFWARADGNGKGPRPVGSLRGPLRLNYDELSLYTEAATGNLGVFVETPYRSVDPAVLPQGVGFGDINLGTKTLLFDCELLQITFLFRTYILTGNFRKGLGVGHVSLEPSLVVGVKLGPETYFQGQMAEWVPLGGDQDYAGALLRYGFAVNHTLYRILPDVPLVGTMELNGWTFQDGAYTDPFAGPFQRSSGYTYLTMGLGLRLFVCDKIDFGLGFAQALTDQHFAEQLYRTEFRLRF